MNARERIRDLVAARTPLVWLTTFEEERVVAWLVEDARALGLPVVIWKSTRGLGSFKEGAIAPEATALRAAAEAIERGAARQLFVFVDAHPFLGEPTTCRALRDFEGWLEAGGGVAVFISPIRALPIELAREFATLTVPLPGEDELGAAMPGAPIDVVRAARGLTLDEAKRALAIARLRKVDVATVLAVKREILAEEEALSFVEGGAEEPPRHRGTKEDAEREGALARIGGLDDLKRWLVERERAFGDEARAFGLPEPKGLLLLGIQGCGKSLVAKSVATLWSFPLLRLHLGTILAVRAAAEPRLRHAIQVAEAMSPAILWVDEIEKGLAGAASGADPDVARLVGEFLTWLQEKRSPVFVVATANEVTTLPPELLRKGRFDEIFFIDLPEAADRARIFEIHIAARGRDPAAFDLGALAELTEHFSGAEIEQVVVAGLYRAFHSARDLAQTDLVRAAEETVPLYTTYEEDLKALREWARKRARSANVNRTALDWFETA